MRKTLILVTSLLCFSTILAAEQSGTVTVKLHGQEYAVETADGLTLYAWFTPSPHKKAPLLVFLPMMGNTHTSYNVFIKGLFAEFKTPDSSRGMQKLPHFLSFDLRGHGKSTVLGDKTISFRTMEPEDFSHYPADVATMINKVLGEKGADIESGKVLVIGASIGANTAIMISKLVPGVSKVVMLSPGENYRSLEPAASLADFKGDVLILAGEEDAYSKSSAEKLAGLNKKKCTLKIYPGPYHGTDLIDANKDARDFVLSWLVD